MFWGFNFGVFDFGLVYFWILEYWRYWDICGLHYINRLHFNFSAGRLKFFTLFCRPLDAVVQASLDGALVKILAYASCHWRESHSVVRVKPKIMFKPVGNWDVQVSDAKFEWFPLTVQCLETMSMLHLNLVGGWRRSHRPPGPCSSKKLLPSIQDCYFQLYSGHWLFNGIPRFASFPHSDLLSHTGCLFTIF